MSPAGMARGHACTDPWMLVMRTPVCLCNHKQRGCGDDDTDDVEEDLGAADAALRGSLVTLRRRCGKPSCHCAQGDQRHEAPALSYSEHGRTRVVMLAESDVDAVTAALERYRAAKAELEEQASTGLAALTERVAAERADRRRGR